LNVGTEVKLIVEEVKSVASLGELLERIEGEVGGFVFGDFGLGGSGRYSYLGIDPREVISFRYGQEGDPFALLEENMPTLREGMPAGNWIENYAPPPSSRTRLAAPPVNREDFSMPFVGGWVGYLGYDLGRYIERLPDGVEHDVGLPLLWFGFYDALLAWDNQKQMGYLQALEYAEQTEEVKTRLERLRNLAEAGEPPEKEPQEEQIIEPPELKILLAKMQRNIAREDYLDKVARSVEYIKSGDIFEVNLSQRFSCAYVKPPGILYEYLARHNPAGYAGLIQNKDQTVVSASPELFLSKRGRRIVTRPIKGTVARGRNEQEDRWNRAWLERSEKDIAELNMIIDLERNDLGRVCEYGTVEVLAERGIEAHPTVYHAVATVAGQLRDGVSVANILRATFPGGSITGAPKIRAMEIIDELEPTARSVYTGSIGWIGVNGDMDLNIAIRTIILERQKAYVQAGGAVVADSEPQSEYEETLAKAAALIKALWVTSNISR
jgi:para-aminobenzoate synthetase component 1